MARQMGFQVAANDWEEYSRVINSAHLTLSPAEAEALFSGFGGLKNALTELNTLQEYSQNQPQRPLISRHYAPSSTAEADYRTERLFYTRENALFIDLVREHIDRWFPEGGRAHDLLLALLLYQAATHVNTSGVFKAYHKGFGGHSRDALGRIMAPMQLEYPVLIDGTAECEVQQLNAAEFLSQRSGDLCYLDPPYNIHQYGSNYHLLNTIARWDFPQVNEAIGADGRLVSKAGIRPDWQETRSDFCSRATAPQALRDVLEAADARWLVLSYNSEGIIPMEQLMEILSTAGRVEINSLDYITYRGGRQSMNRRTYNTEFQIVVERYSERGSAFSQPDLGRFLPAHRIQAMLQGSFVPERLSKKFITRNTEVLLAGNESWGRLATENLYRFHEIPRIDVLQKLATSELKRIETLLEEAACTDRQEELNVVRRLMCSADTQAQRRRYQKKVLHILKKFTHKKYRQQWEIEVKKLQELLERDGSQLEILRQGLADLIDLGHRRFEG